MSALDRCASYEDYRALARARLPRMLFDYIDGGSWAEVTLRRNVADLAELAIEQRVGRDMSALDLSCELLGQRWTMPVALAPVGFAGMFARRGELQAARAEIRRREQHARHGVEPSNSLYAVIAWGEPLKC